jgi:hypothetical protein
MLNGQRPRLLVRSTTKNMPAHTDRPKRTLNLDMMLEEKRVHLDEKKWDLTLWEAALMEVQVRGLNP